MTMNIYNRFRYPELYRNHTFLVTRFVHEGRSPEDIAKIVGCNVDLVNKRLLHYGVNNREYLMKVYTGRFHAIAKHMGFVKLVKPFIKNIETTTDEIYPRLTSINAKMFRDILDETHEECRDTGSSSGHVLGYPRKAFWYIIGKFVICLYDFDSYYAELFDRMIYKLMLRMDEVFLSSITCDPANHYPTRSKRMLSAYMITRQGILVDTPEGKSDYRIHIIVKDNPDDAPDEADTNDNNTKKV